ncbi:MAG: EAL domain-containing protein [Butyrivibrio sp.]|nr:EAL domain-containing protein [Butyrivibrio sp.]
MYKFQDDVRETFKNLNVPMLIVESSEDGSFVPVIVSKGFLKFNNLSIDELKAYYGEEINLGLYEKVHPDERAKLRAISIDFLNRRSEYDITFRMIQEDGYHLIHSAGYWQTMDDGTELAFLVYTDVQKHEERLLEISKKYNMFQKDDYYTDTLTNLPNMNYLNRHGEEKAAQIRSNGGTPLIIYIDIDSMQSYNRNYGIEKGDELLVLVSNVLMTSFPHGLVVRSASDHFTVIDRFIDKENVKAKLDSINNKIKSRASGTTTGINVGVYVCDTPISLTESIDHAIRANKLVGDDLNLFYRFYTAEDDILYNNQRYIVENFKTALEENWIRVFYQCFLRVETGNGMGFEALARWIDPERGMISPDKFIPTLEKYHLMHELDLYIFETVCKEIRVRFESGLPLLPVSVNFSRQDFDYVDVVSEINRIYDKYDISQFGIDKSYFIIEITEQGMATATDKFYKQLDEIRKNGYKLWVDDFGSGYSSLNVFSNFDIDLIKFDMNLLMNLDAHNGTNRKIIKAMIDVAHKLGIHTLCEGLETEEQRQFLMEAGCELAQGFLYHKPEGLEAILERLNMDIPIPNWETEDERNQREKHWR